MKRGGIFIKLSQICIIIVSIWLYHSLHQISEKILYFEEVMQKFVQGGLWASTYLDSTLGAQEVCLFYQELISNRILKISCQFIRQFSKYSISYNIHYVGARILKYLLRIRGRAEFLNFEVRQYFKYIIIFMI